jgi:hypothetical protein
MLSGSVSRGEFVYGPFCIGHLEKGGSSSNYVSGFHVTRSPVFSLCGDTLVVFGVYLCVFLSVMLAGETDLKWHWEQADLQPLPL